MGKDMDPKGWLPNNPRTRLQSRITSLDLSENPVGAVGAKDIADMLDPNVTMYGSARGPAKLILNYIAMNILSMVVTT